MVFGVFDGLHEGHRFFLTEAGKQAEKLVVVVAPDSATSARKGREPHHTLKERIEAVSGSFPGCIVTSGDETEGAWSPVALYKPEVIFLGYDQKALGEALMPFSIPLIVLSAHRPEEFKSSLIQEKL